MNALRLVDDVLRRATSLVDGVRYSRALLMSNDPVLSSRTLVSAETHGMRMCFWDAASKGVRALLTPTLTLTAINHNPRLAPVDNSDPNPASRTLTPNGSSTRSASST